MRALFSVAILALLFGCSISDRGGQTLVVTDSEVALSGPAGFCPDLDSSTITRSDAFVVYGNCGALAGNPNARPPSVTSLVTIAVTPTKTVNQPDDIRSFFASDDGRALLSRQRSSDDVTVTDSFAQDGVVYLYVTDTSEGRHDALSDSYWRAYIQKPDALLAVTVLGLASAPLEPKDGLRIAIAFSARLRPMSAPTGSPFAKDGAVGRLFN